jgi:hypothetical protein
MVHQVGFIVHTLNASFVEVVTSGLCAGGVDGMEAIRKDLESAVAVDTTCEDEAKVSIPIAEKLSHKEAPANNTEDAGSVDKEEVVKSEAMDLDEGKTLNGVNSAQCKELSSKVNAAVPDEVQRTEGELKADGAISGPVACGESGVSASTPHGLGEVEVSTMTSDTCAEVEVSTSLQEDALVKSEVKEQPMQNAVTSSTMTKVSYEGVFKIFRTDAAKIIKLTIGPIGRHHP